jgi:hypothetical protein
MQKKSFIQFNRSFLESVHDFTIMGFGEIGGKAHGLAIVKSIIENKFPHDEFSRISVKIPKLTVITTQFFDSFMNQNNLFEIAYSNAPDERIAHAFLKGELPPDLVGDLWALISDVHTPLAVRSSSLLEDTKREPFAGIYLTKMIPNNQFDIKTRFRLLTEAIKIVYASTFFKSAKDYMQSTHHPIVDEKMAVIIQEVIGKKYGDRFYPNLSGVGRSYNYYPFGHAKPRDGIIILALGLGKTIVDGGTGWAYSPAYPRANPPYNNNRQLLKETQTKFWCVNMGKAPAYDPTKETEFMQQAGLMEAEYDGTLTNVASTYDVQSERIVMGTGIQGPRVITFAPILSADVIPLNDLLVKLMAICEEAFDCEIEMEFAVTFDTKNKSSRFSFLQVRPMVVSNEIVSITEEEMHGPNVILASETVLGNGIIDVIQDVVYVKPDVFDRSRTPQIAIEIAEINRQLTNQKKPYLLIGFGRWGSSDHWLGIPVAWGQICGAKVIVEATLENTNVELSQGSHFFHNLNGFQVSYFSVNHYKSTIHWQWLNRQKAVMETKSVRHVGLSSCLRVKVDGRIGKGVIAI